MTKLKSLRSATKLTCISVALCTLLFLAYVYTEPYFSGLSVLKKLSDASPLLGSVPQTLQDTAISTTPGKMASQFGFQFEVPCSDIKRTLQHGHMVSFQCTDKRTLTFYDPDFSKAEPYHRATYDSISYSLRALPSQLSLVHSRTSNERLLGLLVEKSGHVGVAQGHIFSVERPNFRGFQMGDPSGSFLTNFDLFDSKDHHIKFWIASETPLSQEQINRTIDSMKQAPNSTNIESSGHTTGIIQ
jgi:hypothetical protein